MSKKTLKVDSSGFSKSVSDMILGLASLLSRPQLKAVLKRLGVMVSMDAPDQVVPFNNFVLSFCMSPAFTIHFWPSPNDVTDVGQYLKVFGASWGVPFEGRTSGLALMTSLT